MSPRKFSSRILKTLEPQNGGNWIWNYAMFESHSLPHMWEWVKVSFLKHKKNLCTTTCHNEKNNDISSC